MGLIAEWFHPDPKARSLSFYCRGEAVAVDDALLDELETLSRSHGRCNVRLCLHGGPEDPFHEMIILEYSDRYFPPHRHRTKGESCHPLRGRVAMVEFGEDGAIRECFHLGEGEGRLARVGIGRWHSVLPLSDFAIYHEAKPGPFLGAEDSEYPDWAPGREDPAAMDYGRKLLEQVESLR